MRLPGRKPPDPSRFLFSDVPDERDLVHGGEEEPQADKGALQSAEPSGIAGLHEEGQPLSAVPAGDPKLHVDAGGGDPKLHVDAGGGYPSERTDAPTVLQSEDSFRLTPHFVASYGAEVEASALRVFGEDLGDEVASPLPRKGRGAGGAGGRGGGGGGGAFANPLLCRCLCGQEGAAGALPGSMPLQSPPLRGEPPGELVDYFHQDYLRGLPFSGEGYNPTFTKEAPTEVLEHLDGGIKVWSEAVDLRLLAPKAPFRVLFHYTDGVHFAQCADPARRESEILASLQQSKGCEFGKGVYCSSYEPAGFQSKAAVLYNNYWPSSQGVLAEALMEEQEALYSTPAAQRAEGPGDPENAPVCDAIRQKYDGLVDFCVPVLVPEAYAYYIWERHVPELCSEIRPGQNRWGERQWSGRDVWVIHLDELAEDRLRLAGHRWRRVEVARKRLSRLEELRGRDDLLTLQAVHCLAELLHAVGRRAEAEPLLRRALAGRATLLGPWHFDHMQSFSQLNALLREMGKEQDVQALNEITMKQLMATLTPRTAASFTKAAQAVQEEAETPRPGPISMKEAAVVMRAGRKSGSKDSVVGSSRASSKGATAPAVRSSSKEELADPGAAAAASKKPVLPCLRMVYSPATYEDAERPECIATEALEVALGPAHPGTLQATLNLADVLRSAGKHADAEALYRHCVEGRKAVLGALHHQSLFALAKLASILSLQGKHDEAEKTYSCVFEGLHTSAASEHPLVVAASKDYAEVLSAQGKHEAAEPFCQRVLSATTAQVGAKHVETLKAARRLAETMWALGKHAEAEHFFRQALDGFHTTCGPTHGRTIRATASLGQLLASEGRYLESVELHRRAWEACKETLGTTCTQARKCAVDLIEGLEALEQYPEAEKLCREMLQGLKDKKGLADVETLQCLHRLAGMLAKTGQLKEAQQLSREALDGLERKLGPKDVRTLGALDTYTGILLSRGLHAEAEDFLLKAIEGKSEVLGPMHLDSLEALSVLGQTLQTLGRHSEAEPLIQCALEGREKVLGKTNPLTLHTLNSLAQVLSSLGRHTEAEQQRCKALEKFQSTLGATHPTTLECMLDLADFLRRQSNYAGAETLYRQVVAAAEEGVFLLEDVRTTRALHGLALVERAWNRLAEAESLLRRVLHLRKVEEGADEPLDVLAAADDLGRVLAALGDGPAKDKSPQREEAVLLHCRALHGRRMQLGARHALTLESSSNLAELYLVMGMHEKAEALLRPVVEDRESRLGLGHPSTQQALRRLVEALTAMEQHEEVRDLQLHLVQNCSGSVKL